MCAVRTTADTDELARALRKSAADDAVATTGAAEEDRGAGAGGGEGGGRAGVAGGVDVKLMETPRPG